MTVSPIFAAYYYPGWHPCPVRDAGFPPGWSEWDLLFSAKPVFEGHEQPNIPLWGREDESDPSVFERKIEAASNHGIDVLVFAFYWSRGKRLLEGALERGFLRARNRKKIRFALMWANRMPRRVLPVKPGERSLIDPSRLVHTDPDDFLELIHHLGERFFGREEYFRIDGKPYFSIFDTSFFLRQMSPETAGKAIARAREKSPGSGGTGFHLGAIDPIPVFRPVLARTGFDSVTHYVFLPEWKGHHIQDFSEASAKRAEEWKTFRRECGLPYFPSVSPGWDATPRGAEFGREKPGRYPWSPVVTGRSPESFEIAVRRAVSYSRAENPENPLVFISSWNEWTEGHYLEPDLRYGFRWLEAVRGGRHG